MNIILHSDDMLLLDYWEKSINNKCIIIDDVKELFLLEDSLIVTNLSSCSSKCGILIKDLINKKNKILVLDHEPTLLNAKGILKYGAHGYGNAIMREHFLNEAISTITEGMLWLYPTFVSMLIDDINNKTSNENKHLEILSTLTNRQKEVAKLIADGFPYKEIAEELNITPRTVKSHAQKSYKKLGVKDRLGLALLLK